MCAFALRGEHTVYSLVPNIPICIYIYWPKVNLYQVVFGQQSVRTLFKSLDQINTIIFIFANLYTKSHPLCIFHAQTYNGSGKLKYHYWGRNYANFLGMHIDSKLEWHDHIQYVRNKISSSSYAMRKVKNLYLPQIT